MTDELSRPEDWSNRYLVGDTPWERAEVTQRLRVFLENTKTKGRVLIPGCGSGYEVKAFVDAGFDVLAIDFAEAAVERARGLLGKESHRVVRADFFAHDFAGRQFDWIYERTFLTAFPPGRRNDYARLMAELLPPGSKLIGTFFHGPEDDPPPYSISETELQSLLEETFKLASNEPVMDSLPLFEGKERWLEWQRR
jgi:hypothetical protein